MLADLLWTRRLGGACGFGLPEPWDAFSDGTTNTEDTVYSVTTAWAGLAFYDAWDATGDTRQLRRAEACATALAGPELWNDFGGWSWYSDSPHDREHHVYNVTAQVALLWHKLGIFPDRVGRAVDLVRSARTPEGTYRYADYTTSSDLAHDAYVVEFLLEADPTFEFDRWFTDADKAFLNRQGVPTGPKSKGPGWLLIVMAAADHPRTDEFARNYTPRVDQLTDDVRHRAALAFGLAAASS